VRSTPSASVNLVREWIRRFPDAQKDAIVDAFEAASISKIRRALRLLDELSAADRGPTLGVELLSTFNLEPVVPALQLAFNCLPSRTELRLAPLDAIEAHLANPSVEVPPANFVRLIMWRLEELLPEALLPFTCGVPQPLGSRVDDVLARIERVTRLHQRNFSASDLFLSTVPLPLNFSNPVFAAQHTAGVPALVARINQRIYEVAAATDGVRVLDLFAWAAQEGRGHVDATLDFLARQPLSANGQVSLALFIARTLRPLIVPRRKVIAIDFDNTIWGGVVGEDGVEGLKLGHEFPGNIHLRIQRELIELQNRGVLLAAISKNNEADAREAFESLPEMILKWDNFAIHKVNWEPKYETLQQAARELGLGLDSFVLIDDSDYEREQVHQLLPDVLVLGESSDPLKLLRALWETDAFDSLSITKEDRQRHQDYAMRKARDVQAHGDDLETFLDSLGMEASIQPVDPSNLERVVTLLGKTNQFNLTTRRHPRSQVQAMLDLPGTIALTLRLRDKFGDQGIIAILIAIPHAQPGTLIIDSFLVSCRALGRGVEDALWAEMIKRALAQGVRRLEAEYVPTAKNSLVSKLYDRLGLERREQNAEYVRYSVEPVIVFPHPRWIGLAGEAR
jgi:FkbH-like protein